MNTTTTKLAGKRAWAARYQDGSLGWYMGRDELRKLIRAIPRLAAPPVYVREYRIYRGKKYPVDAADRSAPELDAALAALARCNGETA